MGQIIDLSGQKFNKLTVVKFIEVRNHKAIWLCDCDCGKKDVEAVGYELRNNHTKSCGCLHIEKITKHGLRHTKLYGVHKAMKQRCLNPNNQSYKNYGGRGIKVCAEWLGETGFITFHQWSLNNGYSEGLTLERNDTNGDYEPSNCEWATYKKQLNNTRRNRFITINGQSKTLSQWSELSGINKKTLSERVRLGWNEEDLLLPPGSKRSL
jgi:hypothetical protein